MTIMELGALGEFISVFVVVGTLIYLASEVRQTRRAMLASAYQARAEMQAAPTRKVIHTIGAFELSAGSPSATREAPPLLVP